MFQLVSLSASTERAANVEASAENALPTDYNEYLEDAQRACANLGARAREFSRDLRDEYKLFRRNFSPGAQSATGKMN